jgi:anti-sigma regulatory factor (Ser/Thr protein kinase)
MATSQTTQEPGWQTLAEFVLPSRPNNASPSLVVAGGDNDHQATAQIAEIVRPLNLPATHLERLKTAVTEAVLNVMAPSRRYQANRPVLVRVLVSEKSLPVDQSRTPAPGGAKLAGQQSPRGWGFFLIEKMMDELPVTDGQAHHTIELFLYLEGGKHGKL